VFWIPMFDIADCFIPERVEHRLAEEVERERPRPISISFIDNFSKEAEVHVIFDFFPWAVGATEITRRGCFDEDVARKDIIDVPLG